MLVETAWKSCSGARAIISTLKMNPAAAAPSKAADDERAGVEQDLFAEHDHQHRGREAGAAATSRTAGSSLGEAGISSAPRPGMPVASLLALRAKAAGTTRRLSAGAATIPIATADWPFEDADRDEHREDRPEAGLGEDQRGEQAEAAVPGEVAAGEVAGGVEEDRGEVDPVEGFVAVQEAVLDRPAQRQRDDREVAREAELDLGRDQDRLADRFALREVFGDVAGEQLVDRPVEGRDGDEDRRPEDRDLAVVGLREDVRGDEEVERR